MLNKEWGTPGWVKIVINCVNVTNEPVAFISMEEDEEVEDEDEVEEERDNEYDQEQELYWNSIIEQQNTPFEMNETTV